MVALRFESPRGFVDTSFDTSPLHPYGTTFTILKNHPENGSLRQFADVANIVTAAVAFERDNNLHGRCWELGMNTSRFARLWFAVGLIAVGCKGVADADSKRDLRGQWRYQS